MFGRSKDPIDELYDQFVRNQNKLSRKAETDYRRSLEEEGKRKAEEQLSAAMGRGQQVSAGSLLGANSFGGASNMSNHLAQAQMVQQAAMQQATMTVQQPPPVSSQRSLDEVAAMIGVTPASDGFVTLTLVLAEIVRRTGIQQPIKKQDDYISALIEAKE